MGSDDYFTAETKRKRDSKGEQHIFIESRKPDRTWGKNQQKLKRLKKMHVALWNVVVDIKKREKNLKKIEMGCKVWNRKLIN